MRCRGALRGKAIKDGLSGAKGKNRDEGQRCAGDRPRRVLADNLTGGAVDEASRLGLSRRTVLRDSA